MPAAFYKLKGVLTTGVLSCGVCACSAAQSNLTLDDLMDRSPQALPSMGFSRQEYWSGLPFPSLGDLSDPGIKLTSLVSSALAGGWILYHCATRKASVHPLESI